MVQGPAAYFQSILDHCGSEPARDDCLTFDKDFDCYTAIASRLAPTGFCVDSGICARSRSLLRGLAPNEKGQTVAGSAPFLYEWTQSVSIRECLRVSFMVMYTSNDTAIHAVTYQ